MQEFDVIICGAGPAGSTCALALVNSNLKVALLDKQTFPREKICGDAYGGYAYKILNTISPKFGDKLLALNKGVISRQALIVSPNGHQYFMKLKGFFSNLPRTVFDNFLLQMVKDETNTKILENVSIQNVEVHPDYVIVKTNQGETLKAKAIIGCDGAHSVVRTALTKTRESVTETCPGLRGYYKNVKRVSNDCIEIHFIKEIPKGYFWIFPSTDGLANVGIAADKETLIKQKINLRKEFFNLIENSPQFKNRFENAELMGEVKGWTIPLGYFESKSQISGRRVLLCGDAASLADPSTGEGIAQAMSSGRFAGKFVQECFKNNDFSAEFMTGYNKIIHKKYARDYLFKHTASNIYHKFPFILDWVIYLLSKMKTISMN